MILFSVASKLLTCEFLPPFFLGISRQMDIKNLNAKPGNWVLLKDWNWTLGESWRNDSQLDLRIYIYMFFWNWLTPPSTHPKFNSSTLKNDDWKTTFFLEWFLFKGYVKLLGSRRSTLERLASGRQSRWHSIEFAFGLGLAFFNFLGRESWD